MKKYNAFALLLPMVLLLFGCSRMDVVLDEVKTYEIRSDIHSLDIQLNAADFTIERSDKFSVHSNLKYLSVSEANGVLTIRDEARGSSSDYEDAVCKLYLPENLVLEDISIVTGAAKLTASNLSTNTLKMKLGAGDFQIATLNVNKEARIEGGAGKLTIAGGTIHNLKLEMGVGQLNLTAVLRGDCDLDFGVGESNITLLGSKNDYDVELEKGIGDITVDGKRYSEYESKGDSRNSIEMEGGVGSINLYFKEATAFFSAKVMEVSEGSILVEVTDTGSTAFTIGLSVHVSTNFDGYTDCAIGDVVKVSFDGLIQEIYPPIIPNVTAIVKIS